MKTLLATLISTSALLLSALPVVAQTPAAHDSHGHGATTAPAASAPTPTAGEVRRIDKAAKKITLRHEEIRNLEMAPMTMVFQVQDPALLDSVQTGDRVLFTADKVNGAFVVLTLKPAGR